MMIIHASVVTATVIGPLVPLNLQTDADFSDANTHIKPCLNLQLIWAFQALAIATGENSVSSHLPVEE